jgi:hypothetical protein
MNLQSLKSLLTVTQHATPAARTASLTATGLDVRDYAGELVVTQAIGVVSGTSPTWDGKIQDSADNSTWADVAGYTFTQVTASTDLQVIAVDTRKVRRYIRYVGTLGGSATPTFNVAVIIAGIKKTT